MKATLICVAVFFNLTVAAQDTTKNQTAASVNEFSFGAFLEAHYAFGFNKPENNTRRSFFIITTVR